MPRDDAADIKRQLTDRLESLLDHYWPSWVHGPAKRSGFPEPKGGHDLGSFEVYLTGAQRGEWFRRSQGIGGDAINLLAYAVAGDHKAYREAFAEAKRFLGAEEPAPARQVSRRQAPPPPDREQRRGDAFRLWKAARPIVGSLGEKYLRSRGIGFDLAPFTRLRFSPAVFYDHPSMAAQRMRSPAIVAAVQGPDSRFRGLWRIFLGFDGTKAAVPAPKLGMGPCKGGAVWLGEPAASANVCEGLETGLGVRGLAKGGPVACLLSTSGMRTWMPPPVVRSVLIWPDGDRDRLRTTEQGDRFSPSPGLSAAKALCERLTAAGLQCNVQPTPQSGKDYLDVWNEWEAIREREITVIQSGA